MKVEHTGRVIQDRVLAAACRVIGWIFVLFGLIMVGSGLNTVLRKSALEALDAAMLAVFLLLALLGVFMIRNAAARRGLLRRFRRYCGVMALAPEKSVDHASAALGIPVEQALDDLERMCARGYFNGYLNRGERRMVFRETPLDAVAACPGCGALNSVPAGGGACRYCGVPLAAPKDGRAASLHSA